MFQCVYSLDFPTSFSFCLSSARLVKLTPRQLRLQAEAQKSAAENAPVEVQEEGLQHVCASYREALRINASHLEATAGLGETMLDLGRLLLSQQRLDEAHAALTGAGDLLFQYVNAREADETALHNLACVCSLLGRVDECQVPAWLPRCCCAAVLLPCRAVMLVRSTCDLSLSRSLSLSLSRARALSLTLSLSHSLYLHTYTHMYVYVCMYMYTSMIKCMYI